MNSSNKLAIVIPLFKRDFFEETLDTLFNQTDKRFNLYIGNDASPENFDDILGKYKNNFDFKYHFFEENLGGEGKLVEQWERCISLTQNEDYIQILGDDDYVSNNFVETFYKILDEKKKFDLLRFKMLKVSAKSEILQEFPQIENLNSTEHLLNDLNQVYWISISENIFSRSVYNQLGIKKYPLAWRSDAMLVFEFGMENIEVSNNAFVAIRRSQIQLTMNISPKVSKFKKIAMSYFYNDLLEKHEARFKKKDRKNLVKKLVYYTSNINSSQKEILRKNLSFFEMIQFYLFKK
ncbi:glycosyltransferase family 2 protein [Empedobacter falsenii]|uniref:Glycosyltransferase family 2 protein n=1 Tax=Empedobacter falsenii TaxID=343874 RepID=A0A7H9DQB7_9FLAO|nr:MULTISPECIES: glycosyltransferase family 2 protein [Empedobacter]QLL56901.1 glycosyltransferase family 2 protein [Empedobacter falsenii]